MAKNRVFAGNEPAVSLPVPAGVRSGDPVAVGGIIGVAATDRTELAGGKQYGAPGNPDGYASVEVDGTWSLSVPDAVAAAGTPIYIVTATRALTTTAAGNVLFGHTVPVIQRGVATGATKGAGAGNVNIRLKTV
jgi:hypothetical protein